MGSAAIELISHPLCPYVHRAAALLTECNVEFEARHVDLQDKPAWFLELSPRGKVPVLLIDGVTLFESNVILQYLAEVFAPHLVAGDPLERARRRMWMSFSDDILATNYRVSVASTRRERVAAVAAARDTLTRFEALLAPAANDNTRSGNDDASSGNDNARPNTHHRAEWDEEPLPSERGSLHRGVSGPFVEGSAPGLVDFAAGPGLVRFTKLRRELGIDVFAGLPRVTRWCDAICARPSFTKTLIEDFDERFHAFVRHDIAA